MVVPSQLINLSSMCNTNYRPPTSPQRRTDITSPKSLLPHTPSTAQKHSPCSLPLTPAASEPVACLNRRASKPYSPPPFPPLGGIKQHSRCSPVPAQTRTRRLRAEIGHLRPRHRRRRQPHQRDVGLVVGDPNVLQVMAKGTRPKRLDTFFSPLLFLSSFLFRFLWSFSCLPVLGTVWHTTRALKVPPFSPMIVMGEGLVFLSPVLCECPRIGDRCAIFPML